MVTKFEDLCKEFADNKTGQLRINKLATMIEEHLEDTNTKARILKRYNIEFKELTGSKIL